MKFALKVRPAAMSFLGYAIFAFLMAEILAQFKVVDISSVVSPIFIPTVGGLFILLDQGVIGMKRGLKKPGSFLGWTLTILASIVLVGVLLSVLGWSIGTWFGGLYKMSITFLTLALLISLVTE